MRLARAALPPRHPKHPPPHFPPNVADLPQTRSATGNSKPRVTEASGDAVAVPTGSRKKAPAAAPKKKAPAAGAPKKAAPKKEVKPKVKKVVGAKITKAKKAVNGAAKKVEKKEVCCFSDLSFEP